MQFLMALMLYILNLDSHLGVLITNYGEWFYGILFALIFIETAIIFVAFLPGDSILFAAGALAAHSAGILNIHLLFILVVLASVMGNGVSYFLGKMTGPKLFDSNRFGIFKKQYIDSAHAYYERYGGKTIIIARVIPIIRTVAPYIAGIGYMTYRKFFFYNLLGAVLWTGFLLYGSFLFGNIPIVKQHFSLVLLAIALFFILFITLELVRKKSMAVKIVQAEKN